MTESVGNNQEAPDERKPAKKVISGEAKQKKRGLGKKIAETFTGDDLQTVGAFLTFEIILPELKRLMADVVIQGVERKFFGESGRTSALRGSSTSQPLRVRNSSYIPYNRAFKPGGSEIQSNSSLSSRARATHDFGEIILADRADAQAVIDNLDERIAQYGTATVADLYDSVDITSDFTDNKWGWDRKNWNAGISRISAGFRVDLPRPIPLD